jgi:hypothetical protein
VVKRWKRISEKGIQQKRARLTARKTGLHGNVRNRSSLAVCRIMAGGGKRG